MQRYIHIDKTNVIIKMKCDLHQTAIVVIIVEQGNPTFEQLNLKYI